MKLRFRVNVVPRLRMQGEVTPLHTHFHTFKFQLLFGGLFSEVFYFRKVWCNEYDLFGKLPSGEGWGQKRTSTWISVFQTVMDETPEGRTLSCFLFPITSPKKRNTVFKVSSILQYLSVRVCQTGIIQPRFCSTKRCYFLYGLYSLSVSITAIKTKIFITKAYTELMHVLELKYIF